MIDARIQTGSWIRVRDARVRRFFGMEHGSIILLADAVDTVAVPAFVAEEQRVYLPDPIEGIFAASTSTPTITL